MIRQPSSPAVTTIKLNRRAALTEVRCQIQHPMETGERIDRRENRRVAAHFIQKLYFTLNGKQVAEIDTGAGVASNPVFVIRLRDARPGDTIAIRWTDNLGTRGGARAAVT